MAATLIKSVIGVSLIDVAAVNGWPDSQYPVEILQGNLTIKQKRNEN